MGDASTAWKDLPGPITGTMSQLERWLQARQSVPLVLVGADARVAGERGCPACRVTASLGRSRSQICLRSKAPDGSLLVAVQLQDSMRYGCHPT